MPKRVRVWFRKDRRRWYAEYWEFGTRHAKAFRNKAEAQRWAGFIASRFDTGEWRGVQGLQWATAVEQFLAEKQMRSAPSTIIELSNSLQQFEQLVGPLRTDLITTAHIERFIQLRRAVHGKIHRARPVAPRTVNKDLANLKTFLHWCASSRFAHPDIRFKMLPVTRRRFVPPSNTAFAELFRLAREQSPSLHARMVIAVTTGLRRGAVERIGLTMDARYRVDWDTGVLLTLESKTRQEKTFQLGPNTMQVLRAYLLSLPDGATRLFPDPWHGATRFTWERIRRQAGLPSFTFHQLRNMAASLLRANGFSDGDAKELLGHADMRTTQGYLGSTSDNLTRAAAFLDGLFGRR